MTKEERAILKAINDELERRGSDVRFANHRFWPMRRNFEHWLDEMCVIRVYPDGRYIDIFTSNGPDTCFGKAEHVAGSFQGRGWLQKLATAAADAVERSTT